MTPPYAEHLEDVILGGQDGLVNVLGLSIGVAGATGAVPLVIVSGMAAMFSESISMGAVAYTSTKAALDYEKKSAKDAGLDKRELEEVVRALPAGLAPKKVSFIRARLLRHEDASAHASPLRKAVKVFAATMAGSLVPLAPYFIFPVWTAAFASVALSAAVLFATGALKAHWTVGDWKRSGLEMLLVGGPAAIAGYAIGRLFHVQA